MTSLPPDTHIGAVHLTVADPARTGAFYRDVLGFRGAEDGDAITFSASGTPPYDLVLHPAAAGRVRRQTAGLYHFAILLPDRGHLARVLRHLIEAEAPIEGASDHAVSEAVYLHDPEGNGIEIYADRPRDRWPSRGGRLEMTTKALDLDDLFRNGAGRWEGMPAGTRVGHIHLRVNDLERAEAFYAGILGFDVMVRGYPRALFVAAGGYHHHIGLNTWAGPLPPADPVAPGLRHFMVVLPDPGAAEPVLARARAAGIDVRTGEGTAFTLRDPDGIGVMVTN
ncbi:MAG TPA: VOC family protein [bacterium]